jgi:hypothetical protein
MARARRSVSQCAPPLLCLFGLLLTGAPAAADSTGAFAAAGISEADARQAFGALQSAVRANDASAVADLVVFPLRINLANGKHRSIDERKQFLVEYPVLFDDTLRTVVLEQKFEGLFVNAAGIMFGKGQLWMSGVCQRPECDDPRVRVIAINQF